MCGIAGYFHPTQPLARARLRAMRDALAHRGPDDAGEACWDSEGRLLADPDQPAHFALLHRRLSILDLSPAGHQPMASADGAEWIAFNGEIYNFQDLSARCPPITAWRGTSDTEILLESIRQRGFQSAIRSSHGMFALAVFHPGTRTLRFARDRLGKKPLYLLPLSGGGLAFSSEIKCFFAAGLLPTIAHKLTNGLGLLDEEGFEDYWTLGYINQPRTAFESVRQLPAGHVLSWIAGDSGHLHSQPYWSNPMGCVATPARKLDDAADELEALLLDSVRARLVADVPVGLFLSAGVDSALVAALAAKCGSAGLRAFTMGFRNPAYDESANATAIARHLGLPHEVMAVDESQAPDFAGIARQFDQPFGDVSCIPTFFLCQAARRRVAVALTGDGGDEGFAGYDHYREALRLWGPEAFRRALVPHHRGFRDRLKDIWYRRLGPAHGLARKSVHLNHRHKQKFYSSCRLPPAELSPGYISRFGWTSSAGDFSPDIVSVAQAVDFRTYLPDDILVKMDRMSMAVGLEARSPLLDHRVIEFAATLPLELKVDEQGRGKRILRHLLARHVPRELWDRPKTGFTPPWADWYMGIKDDLRRRWRALPDDWINPAAADYVFPDDRNRFSLLTWNFYSWLVFQESLQ